VADPGFSQRGCGTGDLGDRSPQRGPGAELQWGLRVKPPEARDIMLNSRLKTSENFNIKK